MRRNGETGERRGSILDLFLIFLFLLCIVGALLRWQELQRSTDDTVLETFLLVAETEPLDTRTADCLSVGELLYTVSGEVFGRVRDVSTKPAEVTLLSDGTYYSGAWDAERRCRIKLEIALNGTKSGDVVLRDGRLPVAVGQSIILYGERAALSLKLVNLTLTEP